MLRAVTLIRFSLLTHKVAAPSLAREGARTRARRVARAAHVRNVPPARARGAAAAASASMTSLHLSLSDSSCFTTGYDVTTAGRMLQQRSSPAGAPSCLWLNGVHIHTPNSSESLRRATSNQRRTWRRANAAEACTSVFDSESVVSLIEASRKARLQNLIGTAPQSIVEWLGTINAPTIGILACGKHVNTTN